MIAGESANKEFGIQLAGFAAESGVLGVRQAGGQSLLDVLDLSVLSATLFKRPSTNECDYQRCTRCLKCVLLEHKNSTFSLFLEGKTGRRRQVDDRGWQVEDFDGDLSTSEGVVREEFIHEESSRGVVQIAAIKRICRDANRSTKEGARVQKGVLTRSAAW